MCQIYNVTNFFFIERYSNLKEEILFQPPILDNLLYIYFIICVLVGVVTILFNLLLFTKDTTTSVGGGTL